MMLRLEGVGEEQVGVRCERMLDGADVEQIVWVASAGIRHGEKSSNEGRGHDLEDAC